ncbi:MAG TPA: acyltransferase, partial [Polyangiaceae bacterium]|nr:acyltransferase [Polyangiaceae bacterium]
MALNFASKLVDRFRREVLTPPAEDFHVLNGLRGLSAYFVVCFHVAMFSGNFPIRASTAELNWFHRSINGFWVGLDVFYVLSGFLIGRILMLSLKNTGTVEFWSFFTRRSMRIFPAYYFILTLAIFWYLRYELQDFGFFMMGGSWNELVKNSWQNYTYTLNYFFGAGEANPMPWAWSLCVEEHFYLLLPLCLVFVFQAQKRGVRPAWLWALMLIPFGLRALQYKLNPSIVLLEGFYYRSHNRFDEIWYGVLVAYYYVHHHDAFERLVQKVGNFTWIAGVALIGSIWI